MRNTCLMILLAASVLLGTVAPRGHAQSQAQAESEPPGRWLVDRARTFGLSGTEEPTTTEARYVLLWMRAAARLSPDMPDPCLWQFDLLYRLGRTSEAVKALEAYCNLVPDDVAARLNCIDVGFEQCQTLDARTNFCREQLAARANPPAVVSDLHRRLAELARRVGDEKAAREHAQAAVDAFRYNLQARSLLLELQRRQNDPVQRARLLLDAVAASPARGGPVWELARYLDNLSLHDRAAEWYRGSIDDFKRRHPGAQPPPDVLIDLAASYCDGGKYAEAFDVCNQVMAADPALLDAQILMIRIARLRGLKDVAERQRDMVATRLLETEPAILQNRDAAAAAQSAWFHIEIKPEPARAIRLARCATEWAPDNPAIRRCLGWAKLIDGDPAQADAILTPLAGNDPLAAVGLAKALLQQGKSDKAIEALQRAQKLRQSGLAHEMTLELLEESGRRPDARPDRRSVIEVLDAFDRSVLGFYGDPSKVLTLQVTPASKKVAYAQPILFTFTLSNRGSYPVTFGQEGMVVNPQVLVSATGTWVNAPRMERYLSISLMHDNVLMPGEQIVVRQSVDVGPVAAMLEAKPQREATLEFSFLFDPLLTEQGQWTSRLKNVQPDPVKITRKQVDATPQGIAKLTAAARTGTEPRRARAVHTLAGLIAERRRALAGAIDYTAHSVDDAALQRALLAALRDPSPFVRARTLDALVLLELDQEVIESAAPLLADANPLVRMLAVDLFANAQGPVFEPVVKRLSADDPDPLVKALAKLYYDAWRNDTHDHPLPNWQGCKSPMPHLTVSMVRARATTPRHAWSPPFVIYSK